MVTYSLPRVVMAALKHLSRDDHDDARTQVAAIERFSPTVFLIRTTCFRRSMTCTGWLVAHAPVLPSTHPGGENVDGLFMIDFVTEYAATKAARALADEVVA